jgi:hypothetical protein
MNLVLVILIGIIILLSLLVLTAATLSNQYSVERQIVINSPKDVVFSYLKELKNAPEYNKWVRTDPYVALSYRGVDGHIGFIVFWESQNNKVGKGEQEIIGIEEGRQIDYVLRFEKPFKGKSFSYLATEMISEDRTLVKWGFGGVRNFTMKLAHLLFNMKKMLSKDLFESLSNLKAVLEKG